MRNSDYAELKAFMTIVEQGSFSRAAIMLNIKPSTLSQVLRQLEARLGVRLLNRTTRSLSLTEPGAQLLAKIKPAFQAMDHAVNDIASLSGKTAGTLRVHTTRIAAELYIEPLLGDFHRAWPDIILDITVEDAAIDIVNQGFDIGVRLGERLENDMIAHPLGGEFREVAFASPAYLDRFGRPQTINDLQQHRCINWRYPGNQHIYNWEMWHDNRWVSVTVSGPLIVSDRRLAVSAACQHLGIGFWLDSKVAHHVERGELELILEKYSRSFDGFYLYYPQQSVASPTIKAFVDFFRRSHSTQVTTE
ncbi:LysR family transcriptional regulator [[Pantoea] beijingensis]|uniref:LysR family transcriptional regulator n=1 Tax=[Pantoea] beijingensis TaxID=1324864 RepID=A0A443IIF7_9GAMM|nr:MULTISPECIES: LysR substrate-binding domain-containing protein [Erwiniaceae]RWR03935.1 LysR family transcriptional regulator [[Pantoea] beijingensis]